MKREFNIPQDNPFLNDKFNRKSFIDNIMKVFDAYDENIVISLDSAWGTGKTTFIKMWEAYLKSNEFRDKYEYIHFNAWENDDTEDALVPLISLLSEKLEAVRGKEFKETKLYKVGSKVIKKAVPLGVKILTRGLLDLNQINFGDSNEKSIEDYSAKLGESFFDDYKKKKDERKEFKDALIEYQSLMEKKIIIFIDELDRCRPLYAIEVLERIKHFFDIDKFIFVLAIDKMQLSHSICTIYGESMDSVGYFRRFIDYEIELPEPNLKLYIYSLAESIEPNFRNVKYFWSLIEALSISEKLTLRDLDKIFNNIKVLFPLVKYFNDDYYDNFEDDVIVASNIYAYLLIIKYKKPDIYKRILYRDRNILGEESYLKSLKAVKINYSNYNSSIMNNIFYDSVYKITDLSTYGIYDSPEYKDFVGKNRQSFKVCCTDEQLYSTGSAVDLVREFLVGNKNIVLDNLNFISKYTYI